MRAGTVGTFGRGVAASCRMKASTSAALWVLLVSAVAAVVSEFLACEASEGVGSVFRDLNLQISYFDV